MVVVHQPSITGFNEAMIIYPLAIASPTHAAPASLYYSAGPIRLRWAQSIALDGQTRTKEISTQTAMALGDERLANPAENLLVTRQKNGTLVLAAWTWLTPISPGIPFPCGSRSGASEPIPQSKSAVWIRNTVTLWQPTMPWAGPVTHPGPDPATEPSGGTASCGEPYAEQRYSGLGSPTR